MNKYVEQHEHLQGPRCQMNLSLIEFSIAVAGTSLHMFSAWWRSRRKRRRRIGFSSRFLVRTVRPGQPSPPTLRGRWTDARFVREGATPAHQLRTPNHCFANYALSLPRRYAVEVFIAWRVPNRIGLIPIFTLYPLFLHIKSTSYQNTFSVHAVNWWPVQSSALKKLLQHAVKLRA